MGKTRTAFVGDAEAEARIAQERRLKKEEKIKAMKEAAQKDPGLRGREADKEEHAEKPAQTSEPETPAIVVETKQEAVVEAPTTEISQAPKARGKRYQRKLALVENKLYAPEAAVKLAQKSSTSRFDGKVELHMVLVKKGRFEVTLPHPFEVGKKRIEVVSDETIEKLQKGAIDFDILITTPAFLPKLVPFARLLGPRGLMPNPKNGTVVADPKTALEKFSGGTILLQTEKDFPLIHTVVGKISDSSDTVVQNLQIILKTIGKQNIKRAVVAPSMGPSVKVSLQ